MHFILLNQKPNYARVPEFTSPNRHKKQRKQMNGWMNPHHTQSVSHSVYSLLYGQRRQAGPLSHIVTLGLKTCVRLVNGKLTTDFTFSGLRFKENKSGN